MRQVSVTRSELLARRARIGLAAQGRDLLKEKRTALMREFKRLTEEALQNTAELERRAADAHAALAEAAALDGPESVGSAALAASDEVRLKLLARNVAGVPIVEVEHEPVARARTARRYSLACTTPRVDRTAARFESVVELLLDVAAVELSVRRLAEEIETTTRRVNALEHVVLPRLEAERDQISIMLAEREMEERVRLMRVRS